MIQPEISFILNNAGCRITERIANDINSSIIDAANNYGIDPTTLASIAYVESRFNPIAIGKNGEIGIMQINPTYWVNTLKKNNLITHKSDLFLPKYNIRAGAYIYKTYLHSTKSEQKALLRYNAGNRTIQNNVYVTSINNIKSKLRRNKLWNNKK